MASAMRHMYEHITLYLNFAVGVVQAEYGFNFGAWGGQLDQAAKSALEEVGSAAASAILSELDTKASK